MLERASTCLETGGRQLLRAPRRCLRTRRMLHSAFWHHGASDLSLPIWWAASSILQGGSGDVDDRSARTAPSAAAVSYDGAPLDFLYPKKTLALLKKLSIPGHDASKQRRRQLQQPPVRSFTTSREQPQRNEEAALQAEENMAALAQKLPAAHGLIDLLDKNDIGRHEEAWQLYAAIPAARLEHQESASLRVALIDYLAQSDDPNMSSRVLELFAQIPADHLLASSYRAAVAAYISLRMVGPALQLLEDAPSEIDLRDIGIDVVLKRTIADEQWDLSLRVFRLFLSHTPFIGRLHTPVYIRNGSLMPEVWNGVATLPGLSEHVKSFWGHVREYRHELMSSFESEEALSLFTQAFVPQVVDHILRDRDLDESMMIKRIDVLFKDLRLAQIPAPACYEFAIKSLLDFQQGRDGSKIPKLFKKLYVRYRQLCLDSQTDKDRIRPSTSVLRNMIVYHGDYDELEEVDELMKTFHTFYPNKPYTFGLNRYLIHMYASNGKVAEVQKHFKELQANYPKQVDLERLSALLYVRARHGDVEETLVEFNRIGGEFGMVPDLACWNILLFAYCRADDLDGALGCFNSCIDSGLSPDVTTFGTLLDLCAQRGDVEAFEALFTRGKQMGVALAQDVRARSGYVQAFLNAGDPEGAGAIAQGMLRSWQAGSLRGHPLTHTWNLLIQHHALDRDLVAARQRYREMAENGIPVDSWTYGSLMRALVEAKQTNAAYALLRKTMPNNDIPVHALHYAIVMTGFLREGGQGQLDLAVNAYNHMKSHNIVQTEGSWESTIRTLAKYERTRLDYKHKDPTHRLRILESAVESMLIDSVRGHRVHREPRHSRELNPRSYGGSVQAAYGLMISFYAQRGSYKHAVNIMKKAEQARGPNAKDITLPLSLITGTMEAHLRAGEFSEVAKGWNLARTSAARLTKTLHQAVSPAPVADDSTSLLDTAVREAYEQSYISPNRRNVLYKAARVYMRSLLHPQNPDPNALAEAQVTIRDALVNGYALDTFTWNEYIAALASHDIILAFKTCETYLMPGFPGWRELHPGYVRKDRLGYQWTELRHYEVGRSGMMPRYKTLVALAAGLKRVREDERNGIGYIEEKVGVGGGGIWTREVLQNEAASVVRAIETMPRTGDAVQVAYFGG